MTLASNDQQAIIRTERGLTIAGTRITLYIARIAAKPPKAGTEAVRAKLQAKKAKLASRA